MSIKINRQLIQNPLTRPALRTKNGSTYYLREVRAIVAHWTANTNKGAHAMANRNYFNNGSPGPGGTFRSASAHYCIDSDQIVQCLPDDEVGFHIGGARYRPIGQRLMAGFRGLTPNYFAIGFEMCVNSDGIWEQTKDKSVDLAAYLLFKHGLGIERLIRHFDVTGKDCPRMYINNADWHGFKSVVSSRLNNYTEYRRRAKCATTDLNVRSGPGTAHPVIFTLKKDEPVVVFRVTPNGWAEIGDGLFCNSKFII